MAKKPVKKKGDAAWLESLGDKVTESLHKGCTQKELRSVLVNSFLDFYKGKELSMSDGAKIIETVLKIAPAKSDPVESELAEPVSVISYAESVLKKGKIKIVSSEAIKEEGEKEKLSASIASPYKNGDPIQYTKEVPYDGLKKAVADFAGTSSDEKEFETETFIPEDVIKENIEGETMTMESGLTWDEIRENIAASKHNQEPRDSTMSIKAISDIVSARKDSSKKNVSKTQNKYEHDEARKAWNAFQLASLGGEEE